MGTGTEGKLFRVDARGKGSVLFDSDDTHIRTLASLPGGDVLAGTAGEGLILRISPDGRARTLYDAQEPEVVSLAATADGTCYAAVIASEASLVDQAKDQAAAAAPAAAAPGRRAGAGGSQPQVSVSVEPVEAPTVGTGRKGGAAATPRSQVLSISPSGVVESLWSFPEDTVYSLLWQNGNLWVATGLEGKLYRWADQQMLLEKDVDERQIVAVLAGEPGPAFATTNAAALYRVTAGTETRRYLHQRRARRRAGGAFRHLLLGRGSAPGQRGALLVPQRRQRRARPHLVLLDRAARRPGDPADRAAPGALRTVAGGAAGGGYRR